MPAHTSRTGEPDVLDRPIDWERAERSPEFRELIAAKRRFVVPATVFFLAWYLGFILLAGYAEDFMGESVYQGLTVGYCLALTQFLMVLVLGIAYLRRAGRVYDSLADRVVANAEGGVEPGRRFERETVGGGATSPTGTEEAPR
jgi:uncharacterized membrane protein (DUF485 family)